NYAFFAGAGDRARAGPSGLPAGSPASKGRAGQSAPCFPRTIQRGRAATHGARRISALGDHAVRAGLAAEQIPAAGLATLCGNPRGTGARAGQPPSVARRHGTLWKLGSSSLLAGTAGREGPSGGPLVGQSISRSAHAALPRKHGTR